MNADKYLSVSAIWFAIFEMAVYIVETQQFQQCYHPSASSQWIFRGCLRWAYVDGRLLLSSANKCFIFACYCGRMEMVLRSLAVRLQQMAATYV